MLTRVESTATYVLGSCIGLFPEAAAGYQMTFILTVDHVRVGSGQHVDVARPQAEYEGSSHGVFIKIEPDLAHWLFALVPELSLPVVRGGGFMSEIGFNLVPIDVIVRQGGVDLGQRQVRVFEGNFLRGSCPFSTNWRFC